MTGMTRYYVFKLAWSLLGVALGLHFPDVDSRFKQLVPSWFLLHRSILTHGLLLSLILYLWLRKRASDMPALRYFVIGLSFALAVHLAFDFFPKGWTGFALIHIPWYGRTSALFSQAWLLFSIVTCLYLALLLMRNFVEWVAGVGALALSFCAYLIKHDEPRLSAFILLAFATGAAVLARRIHKPNANPI